MKNSNFLRSIVYIVDVVLLESKIAKWLALSVLLVFVISLGRDKPDIVSVLASFGIYKFLIAVPFVLFYVIQFYLYEFKNENFGASSKNIKMYLFWATYLSYACGIFAFLGIIYKFEILKNTQIFDSIGRVRILNPSWWVWDIIGTLAVSYFSARAYLTYHIDIVNLFNF
jgi:hypothetical protein